MQVPDGGPPASGRASARGRYAPLAQPRRWVHHAADLESGQVLTTELDGPMTPAARIERLARLGYVFDTSIFGRPSYRLTPKVPYQAMPEAWLLAYALDYYDPFHDVMAWSPPSDYNADLNDSRDLHFWFAVAPDQWSVLSLALWGNAWPGVTGSVRLYSDSGEASIPISDYLAEHTVDITFTHLLDQAPEILMIVGSGIHHLEFRSVTFQAAPPENFPGVL